MNSPTVTEVGRSFQTSEEMDLTQIVLVTGLGFEQKFRSQTNKKENMFSREGVYVLNFLDPLSILNLLYLPHRRNENLELKILISFV